MSATGPNFTKSTLKRTPKRHGTNDAYAGSCRTEKELAEIYGYTPKEVEEYLTSYKASAQKRNSNPELQKAILAGRKLARINRPRPTQEYLESHGYTILEADAYLNAYDIRAGKTAEKKAKKLAIKEARLEEAKLQEAKLQEAKLQEAKLQEAKLQEAKLQEAKLQEAKLQEAKLQEAKLQEARSVGQSAASLGQSKPISELEKAKNAGLQAAKAGQTMPTIEKLIQDGLKREFAESFLVGFVSGNKELLRAQEAGKDAAKRRWEKPTMKCLKAKFTDEQIMVYLKAFEQNKADEQDLRLTHAKRAGNQAARRGLKLTMEELLKNDYSEVEAKAYLEAYKKVEVPDSATITLNKARHAGYLLAYRGSPKPTNEVLKLRKKYSDEEIAAYYEGYAAAKPKRTQASKDTSKNAKRKLEKPAEQTTAVATPSALLLLAMMATSPKSPVPDEQPQTLLPAFTLKRKVLPSLKRKELSDASNECQENSAKAASSRLQ